MIRIEGLPGDSRDLRLGTILEIRFLRDEPATEIRVFLKHHPVLYPHPLIEWTTDETVKLFPEAPGRYTLVAEWRTESGEKGWETWDFSVVMDRDEARTPTEIRAEKGLRLWVPSEWEGRLADSEKALLHHLESLVTPGDVVYDLGANFGRYACHFARLVGPSGRVTCIEANPICVHFLRTNLSRQGFEHVDILPIAVLDRMGTTPFKLNYGNSNLGISAHSGFFGVKAGHEIQVDCLPFDALLSDFGLAPPNLVKIDVEGVEHLVLEGMRSTLKAHRPTLALELHHPSCARASLAILDEYDYRYVDPETRDELGGIEAVLERFGSEVFQLVALPSAR